MKQLLSISLSILLLLSSSGITFAKHYCGDYEMLAKITFGQEHLSCGMVMPDAACGDEHNDEDHDCCDNSYTDILTDENFAKGQNEFSIAVASFIEQPLSYKVIDLALIEEEDSDYITYHPPPLIKDIPVLYESFLI